MKARNVLWMLVVGLLVVGCQGVAEETAVSSTSLIASGTIQAQQIHIASELGGRVLAVHAAVGDAVQPGALLVELDTTPLLLQLAEAETAVAVAAAQLDLVQAGTRPEEIAAAQAAVLLAEAQQDGAWSAWNNAVLAVENPQALDAQIVDARAQVELAAQGVELAEAQLQQQQLLRDQYVEGSLQRDMADYQVQAAEAALAAATADQTTAQTLLNWLYAIRSEPLGLLTEAHVAGGQYRVLHAGTRVAQAQLDDLLAGPTPQEVAVAETAVALAQAKLHVLEVQQEKFSIVSPGAGVVLEQVVYPGEVVAPAATILTIADLSELTLTVYVPENRIGDVQLGQDVQVGIDSFPGQLFRGQVTRIGSEPEFTPRNVATVEERLNTFYAVDIRLDNGQGLLKPGMPADATFAP
ncbi:MAG: efflux RND transporter periplasmic adaptor subunit [Ardenticatenaceae bacterium]|nr:efflux RND transporter periplasmic adaptor subunit [Ardenticatenaceae bacterium]